MFCAYFVFLQRLLVAFSVLCSVCWVRGKLGGNNVRKNVNKLAYIKTKIYAKS
jgi:hypothetical protein